MKLLLMARRSRCNNKHEQLDTLTEWPPVSCFWRLFVLGAESWMQQSKQTYLYILKQGFLEIFLFLSSIYLVIWKKVSIYY